MSTKKIETTPRTMAALNDLAAGLQMIEQALVTLDIDTEWYAFEQLARALALRAKRRVQASAMRDHVDGLARDRSRMTMVDWAEYDSGRV